MSNDKRDENDQPTEPKARPRRRASRTAGPPAALAGSAVSESSVSEPVVAASSAAASLVPPVEEPAATEEVAAEPIAAAEPILAEPLAGEPDASGTVVRKRPWLARIGAGVAAIVVVGLVVVVALLGYAKHSADQRDAKRQLYIQAARQSVLNLTTIHPDTAKRDVQRILDGASGEFKQEFVGKVDPFVSIVQDAKAKTDGTIIEAGLESESRDSANVLVAARSMVTNTADSTPSPRDFRLRVTITDDGGRMTTSKVEFVP